VTVTGLTVLASFGAPLRNAFLVVCQTFPEGFTRQPCRVTPVPPTKSFAGCPDFVVPHVIRFRMHQHEVRRFHIFFKIKDAFTAFCALVPAACARLLDVEIGESRRWYA
jgi:hypothetical protein